MLKIDQHRIGFLLRAVYDVLPTPTNLRTWNLTDDPSCKLCGRPANLEHVMSSCSTALADGRYRWRHDKVLSQIAASLEVARKNKHPVQKGPTFIKFVKEGNSAKPSTYRPTGILSTAKDWDLQVDLKRQPRFPPEVAITSLRPDILLLSRTTKQLLLEMTVPWEERMEEANERKKAKYQPLIEECQQRGCKTWNLPVEVGSQGFEVSHSGEPISDLASQGEPGRRRLLTSAGKGKQLHSGCGRRESSDGQPNQSLAKTDHLGRRKS